MNQKKIAGNEDLSFHFLQLLFYYDCQDGDIIIADKNAFCRSGDIVIGMDGDDATVKRLLIKDGKIIFMPENPDFSPIYPEDPHVIGKVIGCYRKY